MLKFKLPLLTFLTLWLGLCGSTTYAQSCPTFPKRGTEIIDTLVNQNRALAQGTDDDRRGLTKLIAEQMKFELGNWSLKSADSGRPQSKDSLALPVNGGPAFCNWDWQNGSTRERSINESTVGDYLADQHLIPTTAVNHLGTTPGTVVTPVVSVSNDPAFVALKNLIDQLSAQLLRMVEEQNAQRDALNNLSGGLTDVTTALSTIATRPIPTACRVSVFGMGLSCRLE